MWKCTSFVKYVRPIHGFPSTTRFTSQNFKPVSTQILKQSNFLIPQTPSFKRTYANDNQQQQTKKSSRRLWIAIAASVCGGYAIYNILDNESDKPKTANQWQMQVLQLLPLRFTSYLWGLLTHIELPTFMRSPIYKLYSWTFGAMPEEASEPLESYKSVAEFFARRLKSDVRIIEPGPMVSPVDGTVLHFGEISGDSIEQVKGVNYSLEALLGKTSLIEDLERDRNLPKGAKKLYHLIIYLSPGDYHGIHSPVNWSVDQRRYFPGYLFPVAPKVVRFIEGLFAINERVVLTGQWEHGFFSLTPVGATNVGSIVVNFDKELITNQRNKPTEKVIEKSFVPKIVANKGDEIAFFHMGSTVVLIFQCPEFEFTIQGGQKVKLGQQLGQVVETLSTKPPKLNEMVPTKVKVDNVTVSES